MSSLFQTYDDELRDLVKDIVEEASALRQTLQRDLPTYRAPPASGPSSRLQRAKQLTEYLTKARELLLWMERECTSSEFPFQQRDASREKVAEYRKQLLTHERDIKKLKDDSGAADRADLIGNGSTKTDAQVAGLEGLDEETRKQRLQMAKNTESLKQGSGFLRQAERLTNETEEMSTMAINNLRTQTRTIEGIVTKAHDADDEVSHSRKILSDMHREMVKNKAILLIIILVLLLLIFLILYVKFGGSSASTQSSTTTVIYVTSPPGGSSIPLPPDVSGSSGGSAF